VPLNFAILKNFYELTDSGESSMTIQVGDTIPAGNFKVMTADGPTDM